MATLERSPQDACRSDEETEARLGEWLAQVEQQSQASSSGASPKLQPHSPRGCPSGRADLCATEVDAQAPERGGPAACTAFPANTRVLEKLLLGARLPS